MATVTQVGANWSSLYYDESGQWLQSELPSRPVVGNESGPLANGSFGTLYELVGPAPQPAPAPAPVAAAAPVAAPAPVPLGRNEIDLFYVHGVKWALRDPAYGGMLRVGPLPAASYQDVLVRDAGRPWWVIASHVEPDNSYQHAYFDLDAFTAWYAAQPSAASQAFAQLHGRSVSGYSTVGADGPQQMSVILGSGARLWMRVSTQDNGTASLQADNVDWSVVYTAPPPAAQAPIPVSAPPGATAPAPAPMTRAEPPPLSENDLTALKLMLRDPVNQEVLARYGNPGLGLPAGYLGDLMRKRYGNELATQLYQLDQALARLRGTYTAAMNAAMNNPLYMNFLPSWAQSQEGSLMTTVGPRDSVQVMQDAPGWRLIQHNETDNSYVWSAFDPQAFMHWYVQQNTDASRLFKAVYGDNLAVDVHRSPTDAPSLDAPTVHWSPGLLSVPLDGHYELNEPDAVFFDPLMGFVTQEENYKVESDWTDMIIPVLMAGAVAAAASPVGAQALGFTSGTTGFAVAAAGVGAATSSMMTGLMMNGRIDMDNVLRSALVGVITAGVAQKLDWVGVDPNNVNHVVDWGSHITAIGAKAAFSGVLQAITGGKFSEGFAQSLANSLSTEIMHAIQAANPIEQSAYRLLNSSIGSALRIIATPGDPMGIAAVGFLNQLTGSIELPATGSPETGAVIGSLVGQMPAPVEAAPTPTSVLLPMPEPAPEPAASPVTRAPVPAPAPEPIASDPAPAEPVPTVPAPASAATPETPSSSDSQVVTIRPDGTVVVTANRQAVTRDQLGEFGLSGVAPSTFMGPLTEEQLRVRDATGRVYGEADAERISGLRDEEGNPLLTTLASGTLALRGTPEQIAAAMTRSTMSLVDKATAALRAALVDASVSEETLTAARAAVARATAALDVASGQAARLGLTELAAQGGGMLVQAAPLLATAALAVAPANLGPGSTEIKLRDDLRLIVLPGEVEGQLQECDPNGNWVVVRGGVSQYDPGLSRLSNDPSLSVSGAQLQPSRGSDTPSFMGRLSDGRKWFKPGQRPETCKSSTAGESG